MSYDYMNSIQLPGVARQAGTAQLQAVDRFERNEPTAESGQILPPGKGGEAENFDKVESAVSQISDYVQNFQRDLQFSLDNKSGRTVIKVIDSETKEVIRQLPSEEMLRIAENLDSPESLMLSEMA